VGGVVFTVALPECDPSRCNGETSRSAITEPSTSKVGKYWPVLTRTTMHVSPRYSVELGYISPSRRISRFSITSATIPCIWAFGGETRVTSTVYPMNAEAILISRSMVICVLWTAASHVVSGMEGSGWIDWWGCGIV